MVQAEFVRKTTKWRRLEAMGSETSPDSTRSPKTGFFPHIGILFNFLMKNYQQEKHLCKVV